MLNERNPPSERIKPPISRSLRLTEAAIGPAVVLDAPLRAPIELCLWYCSLSIGATLHVGCYVQEPFNEDDLPAFATAIFWE